MFDDMFANFLNKYDLFKHRYPDMDLYVTSHILTTRFGRGGHSLHRGSLCPSPYIDIVIGGLNRGKLLTKLPIKEPDFTYYFDDEERLIAVNKIEEYTGNCVRELIEYSASSENGVVTESMAFTLSKAYPPQPILFCRCEYSSDGRIMKYSTISNVTANSAEIHQESYSYDTNGLLNLSLMEEIVKFDASRGSFIANMFPSGYIYKGYHYLFHHDEGILTSYQSLYLTERQEVDLEMIKEQGSIYTVPQTKRRLI